VIEWEKRGDYFEDRYCYKVEHLDFIEINGHILKNIGENL
jgi:hypothetical protein